MMSVFVDRKQSTVHLKAVLWIHDVSSDRRAFKAKFHYAIWFEAGHRQVRRWSPTSFEPASVMEFGFY